MHSDDFIRPIKPELFTNTKKLNSMFRNRNIDPDISILEALKRMDIIDKKLLIVEQSSNFVGLLSAGDIQRAIIQNKSLDTKVSEILRKNIRIAKNTDSFEKVKQMVLEFRMELCPVLNEEDEIIKVYYWEDFFGQIKPKPSSNFNLPVVIMAGGLGTRLKPLTNVLPKPLIPIGDKTMLEEIISRFATYDCNRFYISVNYKADLIRYYIQNQNLPYEIKFFDEDKPLGTAGSLSQLKGKIDQTFFVSNCDILVEQDFSEILDYHRENMNEITIVAALKHFPIAYGTIETGENGQLLALIEKPELTFKINSGMYILEPQVIDEIPENSFYHITDLIAKMQSNGRKVGVFPVSQNSWQDIGDWKEYLAILDKVKPINSI